MNTLHIRMISWRRVLAGGLFVLPLVAGCHPGGRAAGPEMTGPVRAIWVTRFDYKTPDDVISVMENCRSGGFNTVLFQVRGNGTVSYPSRLEPWARQFDHRDPGFDPLALAIHEAHRRGLKLHAWVNVMPAWMGPGEPPMKDQLYHERPKWFWYGPDGARQPIRHQVGNNVRDWYVSLNPCIPEARRYLVDVFHEILSKYDVDGLHMDYIRFPNEPVVRGERIPDYPRDARTLALFKQETGATPESDPAAWDQWRTEKVTELVSQIHEMKVDTRPEAVLSASVGSVRRNALTHFQDAEEWMKRGIVDAVFLMNYTADPEEFERRIQPWLAVESDVRLIPGLSIGDRPDTAGGAEAAWREIEIARATTGDFCIFAYSSLFDSSNREFARQNQEASRKRAERREILLQRLRSLAPAEKTA